MEKKNSVFIGVSLDGYIADKNGGLEWLEFVPNPEQKDLGYVPFMENIDALVMGRTTFEKVRSFDIKWPYTKPVFVLSTTLKEIPEKYADKVFLVNGSLSSVLEQIHQKGYYRLYIDGGATIQSFLKEDLIDEIITTTVPILIGGGSPLFSSLPNKLGFELVGSEVHLNHLVQNHYRRKREII